MMTRCLNFETAKQKWTTKKKYEGAFMNLYDEEIFLTFYAMSLGERIGAALDGKKLVFCHVDLFGRFWFFRLVSSLLCFSFRYYPLMFSKRLGLD